MKDASCAVMRILSASAKLGCNTKAKHAFQFPTLGMEVHEVLGYLNIWASRAKNEPCGMVDVVRNENVMNAIKELKSAIAQLELEILRDEVEIDNREIPC